MRIRKFNENENSNSIDFDYVKECFIELLDDKDLNSEIVDSDPHDNTYISLGFDIPIGRMSEYYEEEDLLKIGERLNSFYSSIYSSVEKVRLQYPNVNIQILHDEYGHDNIIVKNRGLQYITVNVGTDPDF